MKFQPKKAEPSFAERKSFGARLERAERLMLEGKPLKIDAPTWAAEEVATSIPYLRYYAKTGMIQGSDTQSPLTYIRPDDIAYEVWQAALSFKGRISKRTGDGAKFLRDADALSVRAKSSEAQFLGVCQEIRYAYVAGYYPADVAKNREIQAINQRKKDSMDLAELAAEALEAMIRAWAPVALPKKRKSSKYAKFAYSVEELMQSGISRAEAIRKACPPDIKTAKQFETFRKGIERELTSRTKLEE